MTLEEILKRLRNINAFLDLSNEEIIDYAGETARGCEYAVKAGKTWDDISEFIKELETEGLSD